MAGKAKGYTDFYKREDEDNRMGVPTPVKGAIPAKPGANQGPEVDPKKEAMKRRLKRTAQAMKAKSRR